MRLRTIHTNDRRRERRGTLTVELLLVLPILLVLLTAMIQFSLLLVARQQLLSASREGARVAARGGNELEVNQSVKQVLGDGSLGDARVHCQQMPEDPNSPVPGRDKVAVVVQVPATRAVPNFLRWIVRLEDKDLTACTVMHRE